MPPYPLDIFVKVLLALATPANACSKILFIEISYVLYIIIIIIIIIIVAHMWSYIWLPFGTAYSNIQ